MIRSPSSHHSPCLLVVCLLLAYPPTATAEPPIRVTNFEDDTTVRYPVPLIRGELAEAGDTQLVVINKSSRRDTRRLRALVHKGKFKALTELVPGRNEIVLKAGKHELPLVLNYRPQTSVYVVRAVYMTDNSGDTAYQTQLEDDPQDYAAKLDTAMKLMQTFTAQRMNDLGFGRTTFNLELDKEGKVKVHTIKGEHPAEHYYAMPGGEWWLGIHQRLQREFPDAASKCVVIPAYTRWDPKARKVYGHTARGGGNLALFGSGGFFTWPSSLGDVARAFQDPRKIDHTRVWDDSNGRGTLWANASTGIGATLHELGHTFNLPHCHDNLDVMKRGFDHFGRVFTFVDPPCRSSRKPLEFPEEQMARWAPVSCAALKATRWFAIDARDYQHAKQLKVVPDEEAGVLAINSGHGVRFLGFDTYGTNVGLGATAFKAYLDVPEPPRNLAVALDPLRPMLGKKKMRIRVIDAQGYVAMTDLQLRSRSAVKQPATPTGQRENR